MADLYERDGDALICQVCAHRCRLRSAQVGRCGTVAHTEGRLNLLSYGRVVAASLDPIEKKPLRHFRPGSQVYTVATPGCTLSCHFCQNWEIALTVRQVALAAIPFRPPDQIVKTAIAMKADGIGFSYTEPVVSLAYTLDVMGAARAEDLYTVWHSNGYMTPRSVAAVLPWLDAVCVDLKAADNRTYRQLTGGSLAAVLETATALKEGGVWVEMSTPVLAGVNDDDASIRTIAAMIRDNLGPRVPWHLLRGHGAWQMSGLRLTSATTLRQAQDIGYETGLEHVYCYP